MSELHDMVRSVKCFICDVDGVLTNSCKTYDTSGVVVSKTFCDKDTLAFRHIGRSRKFHVVLMSGDDRVNKAFAAAHNVPFIHTGSSSKLCYLEEFARFNGYTLGPRKGFQYDLAFMGNDVNDLAAMEKCFSICPSDALPAVIQASHHMTRAKGGEGAFREIADIFLEAHGLNPWDQVGLLPIPPKSRVITESQIELKPLGV